MDNLGQYFNIETYYLNIDKEDINLVLPENNWFCCAIANKDNYDESLVDKFIRLAIDRNILSWHGLGKCADSLHLAFDLTMTEMEVNENHPEINVCTIGDSYESIAEQFWGCYGAPSLPGTVANYGIVKLICVSFDGHNYKDELKEYIKKFNEGWLPPDTDKND